MSSSTSSHVSAEHGSIDPPAARRRDAALVIGTLAGPVLWLVAFEAAYVLSYVACTAPGRWPLHATIVAAALLSLAGGRLAWSAGLPEPPPARASERQRPPEQVPWTRWMAIAGAVLGVAFAIAILALDLPVVMLRRCGP